MSWSVDSSYIVVCGSSNKDRIYSLIYVWHIPSGKLVDNSVCKGYVNDIRVNIYSNDFEFTIIT